MTTFDIATARTTADATLARLRSGDPLTETERSGLAELLRTIQRARRGARRPENDSCEFRAGLWLTVAERFDSEFGPDSFGTETKDGVL